MVVVKIGDGFGNQLFNYACGYSVAKHDGDTLKLDTSDCDNSTLRNFELDKLQLDYCERESFPNGSFIQKVYKRVRRNVIYNVIFEDQKKKELGIPDDRVFEPKRFRDKYLHGYWQYYYYFDSYREELIRQFQSKVPFSDDVNCMMEKMQTEDSCAIHVRVGDLTPLSADYFEMAVSIMAKRGYNTYYVFTNDISQARNLIPNSVDGTVSFIDEIGEYTDMEQFYMMSACKSQIISSSSYSWWAAYLNNHVNKIVIAPDKGVKNEARYPKEWILI